MRAKILVARIVFLEGLLLALALLAPGRAARLAPGEPILVAAERAPSVLVGVVGEPRRLDASGYVAEIQIERVVHGAAGAARQMIAWEEPAGRRPPRLAPGQRILVALETLPTSSLWRNRSLPATTLVIAADGYAYAAAPDPAAIELLAAYLHLAPAERSADAGLLVLARLVRGGQPTLAAAALHRIDDAQEAPSPEAVSLLAGAAGDPGLAHALRAAIVELVGRRRLVAARAALDEFATPGSELEPEALEAIAVLDGGLPEPTVARLLQHPSARQRAVGARHARGALAERYLPAMVAADPDPRVRASVAESLAATETVWGLRGAIAALADPAPEVRSAAAGAIARLGEVAVPALKAEIEKDSAAAPGAIGALAAMGAAGNPSLVEIAGSSPSERLRGLALLALGKVRDEHH